MRASHQRLCVAGDSFCAKVGTSVGANDREANRAESRADFIHKIGIVEKAIAETQYRLELFGDVDHGDVGEQRALLKESSELLSIFTAIGKSTKARNPKTAGFAEIKLNICSEVWCVETFRRSTVIFPMNGPRSSVFGLPSALHGRQGVPPSVWQQHLHRPETDG